MLHKEKILVTPCVLYHIPHFPIQKLALVWETGNSPCEEILEEYKSVRICNEKLLTQRWADFSL